MPFFDAYPRAGRFEFELFLCLPTTSRQVHHVAQLAHTGLAMLAWRKQMSATSGPLAKSRKPAPATRR